MTARRDEREDASTPSASDDAALKLWVVLSRAYTAISKHAAADAARHGLTLTEFGILEALYHKGPMLLGEVQKRILVSSGGITFLVDRLAEKGLVERRECESDRRARFAALTRKGERLVREIFPEHAAVVRRAVSGIDVGAQREVASALRTLGVYAAGLALTPPDAADGEEPRAATAASERRGVFSTTDTRARRGRR